MTDIRTRLSDALWESLAPWMTGFCEGVEVNINPDALLLTVDDLSDDVASVLLSLPGIAIVDRERIERLSRAVASVKDHKHEGFWDWHGIGELINAAALLAAANAAEADQ